MKKCLICDTELVPFMSFGKMPIANMFQLLNQPQREQMFNENYAFFSGTSKFMGIHFEKFAQHVINDYLNNKDPFVAEIGSNDGIMLQHFARKKIRHIGFEPSENVAKVARQKGINTVVEFFDKVLAEKIVKENGQADAFIGANVMCHIPYIKSVVEGIQTLVKPEGVVIFEDPYLGDVIQNTTYDQIYDEHTFLYSVHSIQYLFGMFGMEVIDLEPQETHGGSMRYVIAHKGKRKISANVELHLEKEKNLGLHLAETYLKFKSNCEKSRKDLINILNDIKKQGKNIVGYAATSKSTTIINYCGITTEHIDYICDTTPIKHNKFSPGSHIPVKPYEEFKNNYPDYALLFGYNHFREIMEKEQNFIKQGGRWVTYVPEVKVL
jgi:methylation protein EvaC